MLLAGFALYARVEDRPLRERAELVKARAAD
jgi:hypothetical protein